MSAVKLTVLPSGGGVFDCSFLDGGVEAKLVELPDQKTIAYTGMLPRGPFDRDLTFLERVPKAEMAAVYAYLNNRDIQQQPRPIAQRVIIDVYDPLVAAGLATAAPPEQEAWLRNNLPFLYGEIRNTVFAERLALPDSQRNRNAKARPWLFEDCRPGLRVAWHDISHVIVIGNTGKHYRPILLRRMSENPRMWMSPTCKLYVVPVESRAVLAILSSMAVECLVRRLCATLKSDLAFAPSGVFPYFPFPWKGEPTGNEYVSPVLNPPADVEKRLAPPANALLRLREELLTQPTKHCLGTAEFRGPTALYNAFDNPEDKRPAIEALRESHRVLEAAVLAEYGWSDLDQPWVFDRPWLDGTWRYVPSAEIRREYLRRIERLNHIQAGLI